ncbi:hypothetical protein BJ508DRAFT_333312 [Ascobolus immersus RN42]|uniref:Uncharacterized protein n=1 Tax=Ascobolus immersus RN42 TaxID=1160509 RepID=A0A3N4HJY7_ASCIM|nr:hypothetical protein BJ508DRAFT_333312 [Ascobolus immersus RN42]
MTFEKLPYEIRILVFEQLKTPHDALHFRAMDKINYFSIITDRLYNAHFLRVPEYDLLTFFKWKSQQVTYFFLIYLTLGKGFSNLASDSDLWWRKTDTLEDQRFCLGVLENGFQGPIPAISGQPIDTELLLPWTSRIIQTGFTPMDPPCSDWATAKGTFVVTGGSVASCCRPDIRDAFHHIHDRILTRNGEFGKSKAYICARKAIVSSLEEGFLKGVHRNTHKWIEVHIKLEGWDEHVMPLINHCVEFMDKVELLYNHFERKRRVLNDNS